MLVDAAQELQEFLGPMARQALAESPSKWKHLPVGRLDPKHHQESRTGPYANVTRREPAQIVTSRKALDTYIARIQRRVGFAKGVWIKAAKAIGGRVRGAAQWATRHRKAPGSATVKTGTKPSVTLISRLDYMDDVLSETGVRLAMEVAAGRLRRALVTSLRKVNGRMQRRLKKAA